MSILVDKAFERASQGNEILCPCKKCINRYWQNRNVIEDHLVVDGYTKWVFNGEWSSARNTPHPINDDEGSNLRDDIDGLLHDTFRNVEAKSGHGDRVGEGLSEDIPDSFNRLKRPIISPGNDIDVYLQPLIEELKELWEPALAMLLGWSTKGKLACPTCNYDTCSQYLKHSRKMCYLGHQRFLLPDHPLRKDKKSFDGKEENRPPNTPLLGVEFLEELHEFNNVFGKEIDGKSKDHVNSRYDLREMGIRKELQPIEDNDGNVAVRKTWPKKVSLTLLRLGNFFRAICSKGLMRNRKCLEASIVEGVVGRDCSNRNSRYLHDGVKTRFSRYQTEDEECNQNLSPIFLKIGHPIGREKRKDCTFLMDSELRHEAHRYALFNTGDEQVENLIELDEGDFRWSREDVAIDVVHIPDPTLNKKKKGDTQMQNVHGWSESKLIVLNELNQPIGPTKEVVSELGSFLGTLARNGTFCPLNVFNWKTLKTHDDMWNYIKEKYDIPEVGKDWALGEIKLAWRGYKCRLKKMHFYAYADDATRMAKRSKFVSEFVFKKILEHWNSDEAKETSHTSKENRKKMRYPYTVGKTSFAIIHEDEIERIETQESEDVTQSVDAFTTVMGTDHPGRVRLYGRGVTKTLLKQKQGDSGPSSQTIDDEMMQKKIEEMEERMQEKFNAQKDTMERDVTVNIIGKLQHLNPRLTLDPNMLRFTIGSPRDGAALQLIIRPSVGCNNQG
ncbi:hypothetical protein KY290_003802 [Solanum tuberosum]|uniref:Transposase-associated domain-containing protein n=1 Tax=Solanum tuberosum TaxID=4113 RepID=A0ABQ7WU02_SOLTU|nr:hypothetical protein KY290_003802 [Solanum tuberosum]